MFEPDSSVLWSLPAIPDRVFESLPFDITELPGNLQHSVAWTATLGAADAAIRVLASDVPFFTHAAVGFLDEALDPALGGSGFPPFGVILYAAEAADLSDDPLRVLRLPSTDTVFPVVVRRGRWQDHQWSQATPPMTAGGQLACWATSRAGTRQGWLTARHAAPGLGPTVDAATDCTDAALVSVGPPPTVTYRVAAYRSLSAGVLADVHLTQGTLTAQVLDVSTDFDMFKDPKFPLRFSFNRAGVRGNSGAFITENTSGAPLGVYLGAFLPANATSGQAPSGYGLSIYQLENMMNLEVYP